MSVGLRTLDGTATDGCDYRSVAQTVTFAPGQVEQAVALFVYGDLVVEPSETVLIEIGGPVGARSERARPRCRS